jgi:hypothetical protein
MITGDREKKVKTRSLTTALGEMTGLILTGDYIAKDDDVIHGVHADSTPIVNRPIICHSF